MRNKTRTSRVRLHVPRARVLCSCAVCRPIRCLSYLVRGIQLKAQCSRKSATPIQYSDGKECEGHKKSGSRCASGREKTSRRLRRSVPIIFTKFRHRERSRTRGEARVRAHERARTCAELDGEQRRVSQSIAQERERASRLYVVRGCTPAKRGRTSLASFRARFLFYRARLVR